MDRPAETGAYARFVAAAAADADVVGLVLTGSRGRGAFVRPGSDWDVRLVTQDEAAGAARSRYATSHGSPVEVAVFSLSGFRDRVGAIGSENEWDRYSYVHAQVVLDKLGGEIGRIVAEKGVLPAEAARVIAADALDTYINSYYRSARNVAGDLHLAALLDAAESIPPLLTALFALHQRVRPFNKFLRWELENFPLGEAIWQANLLLPRLEAIATRGDLGEQQRLFRDVERVAREHGLGGVVDGWEPDVDWLRGPQT